jgi:hypothetical protein
MEPCALPWQESCRCLCAFSVRHFNKNKLGSSWNLRNGPKDLKHNIDFGGRVAFKWFFFKESLKHQNRFILCWWLICNYSSSIKGASVMLFHPYEGFGWPIVKPWLQDAWSLQQMKTYERSGGRGRVLYSKKSFNLEELVEWKNCGSGIRKVIQLNPEQSEAAIKKSILRSKRFFNWFCWFYWRHIPKTNR